LSTKFKSISTTVMIYTPVDAVNATTGALVVNGVLVAGTGGYVTGTTAQPGDSVTGGSSTADTVNIQISGTHDGSRTLSAFQTTGVEIFNVSNFETHASTDTIDAGLMTGLTTVGLSSSSANGDVVFTGVKNSVAANMMNGAGDLTVTYEATVFAGTSDIQSLGVSNNTEGTFLANGAETITVTSSTVKSTLTNISSDKLATLNVLGDKDLTITGVNTHIILKI